MSQAVNQDERVHIAWLYYMEGLTQSEIADRLGLSRLMVHRALQKCQAEGIVNVTINHSSAHCEALGAKLGKAFDLRNAIVIPTSPSQDKLKETLGRISARIFVRYITDGVTIGVGWGSTIAETARFMPNTALNNVTVISLLGGLVKSAGSSSYEVSLQVANAIKATCYFYAAPMIVDSEKDRNIMLELEHIKTAQRMAGQASVALVGIGEVSTQSSLAEVGVINTSEVQKLLEARAVADILGNFIDINGQQVDVEVNRRVISAGLDTLSEIENVFAIAGGIKKVQAILAALRTGVIDNLVTDSQTAEQILLLTGQN